MIFKCRMIKCPEHTHLFALTTYTREIQNTSTLKPIRQTYLITIGVEKRCHFWQMTAATAIYYTLPTWQLSYVGEKSRDLFSAPNWNLEEKVTTVIVNHLLESYRKKKLLVVLDDAVCVRHPWISPPPFRDPNYDERLFPFVSRESQGSTYAAIRRKWCR